MVEQGHGTALVPLISLFGKKNMLCYAMGVASLPVTAHLVSKIFSLNDSEFQIREPCRLNVQVKFMLLNAVCLISSGSSEEGKRHVSSKTVIITLLVCVVLTTTAFLVTTVYYFRRKDALSPRSQIYAFDKYTSWGSRSNLVSHRSSPLPQLKPKPRLSVLKGRLNGFIFPVCNFDVSFD